MEKRQDVGQVTGTAGERSREGTELAALLIGRSPCWVFSPASRGVSALWPTAIANAMSSASVRIILGLLGYFLRARRLALAAVVLSAVALVLAIIVGQGLLPWTGPTDPIKN